MKFRSWFLVALFLVLLVVPSFAAPAYSLYLRMQGVQGNCNEREHKDWNELLSVKGGNRLTESGPIVIQKYQDDASTTLFAAATAGNVFNDVVIEVCRTVSANNPPVVVGKITLSKAVVKEAKMVYDKTMDSSLPVEEITLSYDLIQWETMQYGADGTRKAIIKDTWNNGTKAKI